MLTMTKIWEINLDRAKPVNESTSSLGQNMAERIATSERILKI